MTAPENTLLVWDFDGTLGHRAGRWSDTLLDALDEHAPGHGLNREDLRPLMSKGLPWHTPEVARASVDADAWWARLEPVFGRALALLRRDATEEPRLTALFRRHYTDHSGWALFGDSLDTLAALSAQGYRHALLSNHVPELPALLDHLGLSPHFEAVFNSAVTGFEKPHPEAFLLVERTVPTLRPVMIGDNPRADVAGAEAVGWTAILVREAGAGLDPVLAQLGQR